MKIRNSISIIRRYFKKLVGLEPGFRAEVSDVQIIELGNRGASWCVAFDYVKRDSVVYSFGVGTDISFDRELIEKFGVAVHGFDPTPRSMVWIASQTLPSGFSYHQIGLHQTDGELVFYPPVDPEHVSFSTNETGHNKGGAVVLKVCRLSTIMRQLGHSGIDLLKMDIEGSEYGVIADIAQTKPAVAQLLVEFHHWMPGFSVAQTNRAVEQLKAIGYKLFYVSASGREYGFIHCSCRGR